MGGAIRGRRTLGLLLPLLILGALVGCDSPTTAAPPEEPRQPKSEEAGAALAADATRARALTYEAWDPAVSLERGDTLKVEY